MANACGLFGDLIPNIYIDRIFLEEALTDTDNDGVADLQTPKFSIQLKVLDSQSSGGNFSILGDALQIETANSVLDFKEYINVYCVVFKDQDLAENFISEFERMNYTDTNFYFGLPQTEAQGTYYSVKKSLTDFTLTYENSENLTEVLASYQFDKTQFGNDDVFDYLRVFAFVQLDVEALEADINVSFPSGFKTIVGRYLDEVVLRNSVVVSELTIFTTEDGDLWDDSFHVMTDGRYMTGRSHTGDPSEQILTKTNTITNNVQDFRIRDEISVFVANFDFTKSFQYDFPEQRDILNKSFSKNSYFSEIFITKDEKRNGRFYFAFDYGKFILQEDKFANIISNMTTTAKVELIRNADLVKFIVKRKQVKEKPARNHLGSPVKNRVQSSETIEVPIVTSLDDNNVTEIGLILTDQASSDTSLVRHFTGVDLGLKGNTDGDFQYSVEIEALSAFTTILNQILKNLDLALSSYNEYVNLTQIPGIYDWQTRKYTTFGKEVLTNWDAGTRLATIINVYTTALDYFIELDTAIPNGGGMTYRGGIESNLVRNINPTDGSVDGIILFQKMLSDLIGQVSNVLSVGSNSVGAESTRVVPSSDRQSLLKQTTMRVEETFDHTIGARFINDTYVDNISPIRRNPGGFPGLRTYSGTDLGDASVTEINPLNSIFIGTPQAAESQGIVINVLPSVENSRFTSIINERGETVTQPNTLKVGSESFVGLNSKNNSENLNVNNLSPKDLQKKGVTENANAPLNVYQQIGSNTDLVREGVVTGDVDTLTAEDLQTEVEVLTAFSRQGSNVTDNSLIMRNPQFQIKKLGDLTSAIEYQNVYYLCKQKQQGNKEVIDAYFFVSPVSATFDTEQDIVLTNPGQFLEEDTQVAETVLEQIDEASDPSNMTTSGVQSSFGAPASVAAQIANDTNPSNMTRDGVDLSEALEEDGSGAADTVIEQMNEATQGMTAQGFKQQGFERPLGT
jgi:hypothetical protein